MLHLYYESGLKSLQLKKTAVLLTLIWLLFINSTWAGSARVEQSILDPDEVTTFAKNVEKFAAAKGARVFIIARVGRPASELPKGILFTHTALAVYSAIPLETGEVVNGYAIYNLYQTEEKSSKSHLVTDYPIDFFWSAYDLKAGIIIPSIDLQKRLLETIASGRYKKLHNPKYSAISNPFNTKFQNCTEFVLDLINAAIYQTIDKKRLKRNAKAYFKPQRLRINKLKLFFGDLLMEDVSTKDHKRKIYTSTFSTIASYLEKNAMADEILIYHQDGTFTHQISAKP
jgi:hypothetical protein